MQNKTCSKCGETKPASGFGFMKQAHVVVMKGQCNDCLAEYARAYRKANPERTRANYRRGTAKVPKEYTVWHHMKSRCYNPNNPSYRRYGGRGISVCDRWMHSYPNFIADMGPKPTPRLQIDRIDNDGNYEPSNCRWTTPAENVRNSNRVQLTTDDVREIRQLEEDGVTHEDIAYLFTVRRETVSEIIRLRSWVTDDIVESLCG